MDDGWLVDWLKGRSHLSSNNLSSSQYSASVGQMTGSRDHIKLAQQYFQLVGASPSECDTIPGFRLDLEIVEM